MSLKRYGMHAPFLGEIRRLKTMAEEELMAYAKELGAPYELIKETKELERLPVVNFAAGGVLHPLTQR